MSHVFSPAEVFATNLSSAMQRRNVSRRGLAKLIDPADPEIGRTYVRRALAGKHDPTAKTVQRFADALELTPEELLPSAEDEQEAAQDMAVMLRALDARIAEAQNLRAQLAAA